jgi:ECF transporter S component (folate family)
MQRSRFGLQVSLKIGVLVAISVVLKVILSFTLATYRFTFYDIPLMLTGIMFGPLAGVVGGFTVDWINIMMPNLATGFNLFTISSMMWGFIPGLFLFKRDLSLLNVSLVVFITSIIAFGLNSLQLYFWMGNGMVAMLPARLITLIIKLPLQVFIIDVLYKRVVLHTLVLKKNTY